MTIGINSSCHLVPPWMSRGAFVSLPFSGCGDCPKFFVLWSRTAQTSASVIPSGSFPLLPLPYFQAISFSPRGLFLLVLHAPELCVLYMSWEFLQTRRTRGFSSNILWIIPSLFLDSEMMKKILELHSDSLSTAVFVTEYYRWFFHSTDKTLPSYTLDFLFKTHFSAR